MKTIFAWRGLCLLCGLATLTLAGPPARAMLTAGTNNFTRPPNGGAAISVQAMTAGDADSTQIPFYVSQVDTSSAQGGVIVRSNDWLYYTPPGQLPKSGVDSFAYVITNLLGNTATGAVSIATDPNYVATNLLTISGLTNNQPALQFFGGVGPYFVQTSTNLQTWLNVAARLAWPTGYFSFNDATPWPGPARFYRAATGASAPVITNYVAAGTANVQVDFALGTEGGVSSPYPATLLTLPPLGSLFQDDGTPITNVPVRVTATNGRLHYFGPINVSGPDSGAFQYKITRPADGLDSLPATFRFSLAADIPTLLPQFVSVPEWGGSTNIQILAADPDLVYSSNHLQVLIDFAPTLGKLYQVNADGTPNLHEQIADSTFVSNASNLVYYVPPGGQPPGLFESFAVQAINSFGLSSELTYVVISIFFVDSAPVAEPATMTGSTDDTELGGPLPYSDFDRNLATISFPTLPARGQLYFSDQQVPYPPPAADLVSTPGQIFVCDPSQSGVATFIIDSHTNGFPCIPDFYDYGNNYASFTYIVTDADGESATNSITINVTQGTPFPVPSGPTNYSGEVDFPITIDLSATNQDGSPINFGPITSFWLDTLPAHGQLSIQGYPITGLPPQYLPIALPLLELVYTPDEGYVSPPGNPDRFFYHTEDLKAAMCPIPITLTIEQPMTTPPPPGSPFTH